MQEENQEPDIFRDSPLRYLGYTNEVGEAFRSIVPKPLVTISYVIASGYVLADTIHKGYVMSTHEQGFSKISRFALSASDTLLWQSFASVIIPGITINRLCAGIQFFQKYSKKSRLKSPWISTAIGLISIPLIIHPIDRATDEAMDATFRKWTGYHPRKESQD